MNNSKEKVLNIFLKFSIGTWIVALLNFIMVPITTRIFAPEVYGQFSIFMLIVNISTTFIILGLDQSYLRFYNKPPLNISKEYLLSLCLKFTFGSLALYGIILYFSRNQIARLIIGENNDFIIVFVFIYVFSLFLFRYLNLNYRLRGNTLNFTIQSISISLTTSLLTIIFGSYESSIYAYIAAYSLGTFFIVVIFAALQRKEIIVNQENKNIKVLPILLKYGLPFLPAFLINWLNESVAKVTIQYFYDYFEVGIFTASFKLISIVSLIQTGFTAFWIPYFYRNYEKEDNEFENILHFITLGMIIFGIILIGLQELIFLLLGPEYSEGALLFPFLLWMPIMYTISEITVVGINLMKKTWIHLYISLFVCLVNLLGCIILVPKFGSIGAAISTSITYLILLVIRTYLGNKFFKPVKSYLFLVQSVSIFLVVCIITYLFNESTIIRVVSCVIAILILLIISKNKILLLSSVANFKKNKK